jgi:tRNA threonylcarbamoyladenosine biosynthesis protein TsaE
VPRPAWFALRGELGAGKSVLARAIARGAGVTSPMPSPTFNLVFRYDVPGGPTVWHVDLYRLAAEDEVWELGWRDFGAGDDIVLVEWPERAGSLQPPDRWELRLEPFPDDPSLRLLTATPHGVPPALPLPGSWDD